MEIAYHSPGPTNTTKRKENTTILLLIPAPNLGRERNSTGKKKFLRVRLSSFLVATEAAWSKPTSGANWVLETSYYRASPR